MKTKNLKQRTRREVAKSSINDVVCNKFVTRFTLVKVVRREKISEKTNRKRNHTYVQENEEEKHRGEERRRVTERVQWKEEERGGEEEEVRDMRVVEPFNSGQN